LLLVEQTMPTAAIHS